jgi:hypothetical protein
MKQFTNISIVSDEKDARSLLSICGVSTIGDGKRKWGEDAVSPRL